MAIKLNEILKGILKDQKIDKLENKNNHNRDVYAGFFKNK